MNSIRLKRASSREAQKTRMELARQVQFFDEPYQTQVANKVEDTSRAQSGASQEIYQQFTSFRPSPLSHYDVFDQEGDPWEDDDADDSMESKINSDWSLLISEVKLPPDHLGRSSTPYEEGEKENSDNDGDDERKPVLPSTEDILGVVAETERQREVSFAHLCF